MAASSAAFIIGVNVGMAIGASYPENIVSDFDCRTPIIASAPASGFARDGATVLCLVPIGASANGIKFV